MILEKLFLLLCCKLGWHYWDKKSPIRQKCKTCEVSRRLIIDKTGELAPERSRYWVISK